MTDEGRFVVETRALVAATVDDDLREALLAIAADEAAEDDARLERRIARLSAR